MHGKRPGTRHSRPLRQFPWIWYGAKRNRKVSSARRLFIREINEIPAGAPPLCQRDTKGRLSPTKISRARLEGRARNCYWGCRIGDIELQTRFLCEFYANALLLLSRDAVEVSHADLLLLEICCEAEKSERHLLLYFCSIAILRGETALRSSKSPCFVNVGQYQKMLIYIIDLFFHIESPFKFPPT